MEEEEVPVASTSRGTRDDEPIPSGSREEDSGQSDVSVRRHLYVSEILDMFNLARLIRQLGTRELGIAFAEENGLIARSKQCRVHRQLMRIDLTSNDTVGAFVCSRGNCRNRSRISRATGTWFEKTGLQLPHIYYLMYCYAHNWSHDQVKHEDFLRDERRMCLSSATITDWYNYCREVVVIYQLHMQENRGKIGGPNKVVQIDESKFGKRKYNRGRVLEGHWVLGLIEDGSEDLRLEVCPDNIRSADVLIPLIQKHVLPGTTIHTDFWRAYDCLGDYGYIHKKVNHSDPDNPFVAEDGTHTYNHPGCFEDLIVEYVWRRWVMKNKKDPFGELIKAVKHVYTP